MKEVLMRIFEANPNKQSEVMHYVQNNYEHYFGVYLKSNLETIEEIDLSNFQSLRENEQNEIIKKINAILDWYNLQP